MSTSCFATTQDILDTVPKETVKNSISQDILQVVATGLPIHDLGSYLNYKRLTKADVDAFKWSFILSQLAQPFEESLEDVLYNDLILQMKNADSIISTLPDILDKDYVYSETGDYTIKSDSFAKIHDTLSKNIRYNVLMDENLKQYTVNTIFRGSRKLNKGYITDFVYTDKTQGEPVSDINLKNNIQNLLGIDTKEKSSSIIEYYENPEKLVFDNYADKVMGQRRLVQVYAGSNIVEIYLQLGLTVYLKQQGENGTTDNFLESYGNCKVYADSFGNIVFYDEANSKYKMILPNSLNPIFTTTESTSNLDLYSSEYIDLLMAEPVEGEEEFKINWTIADLFLNGDVSVEGWNETSFVYNKWLGSAYSDKRRSLEGSSSVDEYDESFDIKTDAIYKRYYPNYIGNISNNRLDYRNSAIITKQAQSYLDPANKSINLNSNWFEMIFTWFSNDSDAVKIDSHGTPSISNIDKNGILFDEIRSLDRVRLGMLMKADKVSNTAGDTTGLETQLLWLLSQNGYDVVLQTPQDTLLPKSESMKANFSQLLGKYTKGLGGGVLINVPEVAISDINNSSIMGDEGGFLVEEQCIYDWVDKTIKVLNEETGKMEDKVIKVKSESFCGSYLLKRDNRISNRFINYPLDDVITLSYVWLHDYVNRTYISELFEEGQLYLKTQSEISGTGLTEELVLLPYQVDNSTNVINMSTYPDGKPNEIRSFLKYLSPQTAMIHTDGTSVEAEPSEPTMPYTNTVINSTYATVMGLYKNTDSAYNNNNTVRLTEPEKRVDRELLANMVEMQYRTPVSGFMNFVSGILQYINNALAVNVPTNNVEAMKETPFYSSTLSWYMLLFVILVSFCIMYNLIKYLAFKRKGMVAVGSVYRMISLLICIPATFLLGVAINQFIIENVLQTSVDKTTLVSSQYAVNGIRNRDAKSEKNYRLFREQFSDINDVFVVSDIKTLKGYDSSGNLEYVTKSIDESIVNIMFVNTLITDGEWYTAEEFKPVGKKYYNTNLANYFYDNLFYNYLKYQKDNDTDVHSVVSNYGDGKITPDDQTKMEKLDKVTHNLKGNARQMFMDTQYKKDNDLFGYLTLFNQKTETSLLKECWGPYEVSFRNKHGMKLVKLNEEYLLPYSVEYLTKTNDLGRSKYMTTQKLREDFPADKATKLERLIESASGKAESRINEMIKYRYAEFSDTAVLYTASIILAEEFTEVMTDLEYGVGTTTDMDKSLRIIYSKTFDDIVNAYPLMYTIQDTFKGGWALNLLVSIYTILYFIINSISVIIYLFIAFVMPYQVLRAKNTGLIGHQFIGIIGQSILNILSVSISSLPLMIGASISNNVNDSWVYWTFALVSIVFMIIPFSISIFSAKSIYQNYATAGGVIMAEKLEEMKSSIDTATQVTQETQMSSDSISMDNSVVNVSSKETEITADIINLLNTPTSDTAQPTIKEFKFEPNIEILKEVIEDENNTR